MKTERYLNEEELIRKAMGALIQELGPVETARFVNLPLPKRMDSVKHTAGGKKAWIKKVYKRHLWLVRLTCLISFIG